MQLKEGLEELLTLDGAMAASVVDYATGMMLQAAGSGLDLEMASAGNSEVVRAKMDTMKALKLNEEIEDILISLGSQYHLIRPMHNKKGIFIYYVLSKKSANLAMARIKLKEVEDVLTF